MAKSAALSLKQRSSWAHRPPQVLLPPDIRTIQFSGPPEALALSEGVRVVFQFSFVRGMTFLAATFEAPVSMGLVTAEGRKDLALSNQVWRVGAKEPRGYWVSA